MTLNTRAWATHQGRAAVVCTLVVLGWMTSASVASAQDGHGLFISVGAQAEATGPKFSESVRFREPVLTEDTTFVAHYTGRQRVVLDGSVGAQRLWRHVGAAVAVSYVDGITDVAYSASVPNPFVVNRPREISGAVTDLTRRELAVHVQALYTVPMGSRLDLIVSGGPSAFIARQGVLQGVEIDEIPPFTSLRLVGVQVATERQTKLGYNVGADVVWKASRWIGLGGVVRYSRTQLSLPIPNELVRNRRIEAVVGGLRVGVAIRLMF